MGNASPRHRRTHRLHVVSFCRTVLPGSVLPSEEEKTPMIFYRNSREGRTISRKEMIERLESANHRLAAVCTAHNDYLRNLTDRTGIDHLTEFDVFFLRYRELYSDAAFGS
jgi:hypothetical protein